MQINKSVTRDDIEEAILSEVHYNWKKHVIFHIPDILSFTVKLSIAYLLFVSFLSIIIVASVSTALDFNEEQIQKLTDKTVELTTDFSI